MKVLELFINAKEGGSHFFIEVDGTRRDNPEGNFQSPDSEVMFARAREMLQGPNGYEPRLRICDPGRRIVRGGNGDRWVNLEDLEPWAQPKGMSQPRVNTEILGLPCVASA